MARTDTKIRDISYIANMYNFEGILQVIRENIANAIKSIMENYSSIQNIMKNNFL